jgi:hypothetical protein
VPGIKERFQAVAEDVEARARGEEAAQEPPGLIVVASLACPGSGGEGALGVHEKDEGEEDLNGVGQGAGAGVGETQGGKVEMRNDGNKPAGVVVGGERGVDAEGVGMVEVPEGRAEGGASSGLASGVVGIA